VSQLAQRGVAARQSEGRANGATAAPDSSRTDVVIAGAGLMGRLLAWRLSRLGRRVAVVDPAPGPQPPEVGVLPVSPQGAVLGSSAAPRQRGTAPHAAAWTAAGMLSPTAEMDAADPAVAMLGWRSLALWPVVCSALGQPALCRREGSLLLAHASDRGAARRVLARLDQAVQADPGHGAGRAPEPLTRAALQALEPALLPELQAWRLPGEGQVLPRELLAALHAEASPQTRWHWGRRVEEAGPGSVRLDDGRRLNADLVIDVRGIGARHAQTAVAEDTAPPLRGVRGEVVWLHAPGVGLQRPVRLLHPRHRVYVVPRPDDLIVVGASEVESDDTGPVTLRTAVELMAAAHSVLPALAEARIVHMDANLRPAYADHLPRIAHAPGLLRINGLFRHGWLMAPALLDDALAPLGIESLLTEMGRASDAEPVSQNLPAFTPVRADKETTHAD